MSSSDSDELDASSAKFNPLKTLYSPKYKLKPETPVFDNVERFASSLKPKAINAPKAASASPSLTRNFSPSQMPTTRQKAEKSNVLNFMRRQKSGPFSALSGFVASGVKIRVVTRGAVGIRGFLVGVLVAFDKHWNLALVDVDETWTRKRHRKASLPSSAKASSSSSEVGLSTIRVLKTMRKKEVCTRHAPQVLLRGEHVVLVRREF